MEVVGGIIFLASTAWALSWVVLAMLRRDIQVRYVVPMMPKEEQRMVETIQLVSPVVQFGAGLYMAASASVSVGLLVAAVGVAMFLATVRQRAKRMSQREAPSCKSLSGD